MNELSLTSPAFADGDPIPEEYGRDARDVNPPLRISGAPEGAASLALVVDDPDAVEPAGKVWDHWAVWNVDPDTTEIPADWDVEGVEGTNDFGERGYGGPSPPDRVHEYRFRLFALDSRLDLPESASVEDVLAAAEGRVLATAELRGTYAPR
jgi:hypothetical protein